jgi:hypothetical protein
LSWSQLIQAVGTRLKKTLNYDQTPCLACPTALKNQPVPWNRK